MFLSSEPINTPPPPPVPGPGADVVLLIGSLILLLLAARWWRTLQGSAEAVVWRCFLLGAGVVGAAVLAVSLLASLGRTPADAGVLIFYSGCLAACGLYYQGLVRWERAATRISDPGDWLNGLSSVMTLASIVELAVATGRAESGQALTGAVHLNVILCAAVLVLLGTTVTVSALAGLLNDVRFWFLMAAMTALSVAQVLALVLREPVHPAQQAVWLLAAAAIAGCTQLSYRAGHPIAATNQATIVGSLVVLVCALMVLTVNTGVFFTVNRSVTAFAAAGALGATVRIVLLVQDLAHLNRTRSEARTDELTGLANRRALFEAMDEALRSSSTTVLMIDLDKFKIINDRFGHAVGDRVLQHTAATFAALVPARALLARLGGDEFAVLMPGEPLTSAAELATALVTTLASTPSIKGLSVQVGACIGVSSLPSGAEGSALLRRADTAMYQAKISGTGVCVYDEKLDIVAQERQALIEDLHATLTDESGSQDQIVVYYQPQLEIATGRVVGAEALVRWRHPRLGLLSPDAFIHLVEANGLMNELTACVLAQAAEEARRWAGAGHLLRVSVNVSASSLSDPDILAVVDHILRWGMAPERLVLEVTETSLMLDPEQAMTAMRLITERGVGVSIDDYGTGYSSLGYLNDLPATELKIDRMFISKIVHNPKTAAIVAATVDLAHQLGLRLVAEGVEDSATWQMLAAMGCDESQGYLHSKPLDPDMFVAWLAARTAGVPQARTEAAPRQVLPAR